MVVVENIQLLILLDIYYFINVSRHLLFHQCVNPSTGYYGTMLYFTCDMIVFKFQIVSPTGLGYVDTLK